MRYCAGLLLLIFLRVSTIEGQNSCFTHTLFSELKFKKPEHRFLGNVKSAIEYDFEQHVPDSLLINFVTVQEMFLDSQGYVTRELARLKTGRFYTDMRYRYDASGLLVEMEGKDSAGKIQGTMSWIFDSLSRKYTRTIRNNSGTETQKEAVTYDEKGNITRVETLLPEKSVVSIYNYNYNESGFITKKTRFDEITKKPETHYMYDYDTIGNSLLEKIFSGEEVLMSYNRTYFDKNCNVIRFEDPNGGGFEKRFDEKGNLTQVSQFVNGVVSPMMSYRIVYKYDSIGNWIEKETYSISDRLLTRIKRKVEYYIQ